LPCACTSHGCRVQGGMSALFSLACSLWRLL
jgi:hypothetical protein